MRQFSLAEYAGHRREGEVGDERIAIRTEQSSSALNYALAGIGLTLVPGNVIPPHFEGIILRPDPPVLRPLAVCTRGKPDPVSAAFVTAISDKALVNPPHIARLR